MECDYAYHFIAITTFIISENITALKDLWIVGDFFLGEAFPTLQSLLNQAHMEKKTAPYMYRYYNVETRYPRPLTMNRSVMARILNSFVKLLNAKHHLPRYVIIIIDKDWFENSGFVEYGAGDSICKVVNWWMKEFNKFVEIRKDQIYSKKPGALAIG